jgi:hypothetical protein
MSVESVDQSLDRGLVEMAKVRRRLAGFLTHHESLGIDESESVDDDFALDGLDGVDDDGDGAWGQLLEGLLRVDVD